MQLIAYHYIRIIYDKDISLVLNSQNKVINAPPLRYPNTLDIVK